MAADLAKSAAGCLGRAIGGIDDRDLAEIRDRAAAWVDGFLCGDPQMFYVYAESIRNIVPKTSPDSTSRLLVTKGLLSVADAFGRQLGVESHQLGALMECVDLTMSAAYTVQRNGNPQIVTEALVAKLSRMCHRR
ncbi:MAG: hypothetical protein ACKO14_12595 [Armatimonadota bacterium]